MKKKKLRRLVNRALAGALSRIVMTANDFIALDVAHAASDNEHLLRAIEEEVKRLHPEVAPLVSPLRSAAKARQLTAADLGLDTPPKPSPTVAVPSLRGVPLSPEGVAAKQYGPEKEDQLTIPELIEKLTQLQRTAGADTKVFVGEGISRDQVPALYVTEIPFTNPADDQEMGVAITGNEQE